jgi:hypothetical protein
MAYTNKKSAKRKHKKYRRRTKKGGVVRLVANPNNSQAISRKKSPITEVDEAAVFQGLADDYTRRALDNAVAIFSREQQRQAQAPLIDVTVHGKSRARREGPTPGQIKKAEQKEAKALAKQQKEEEKAQKKIKKEQEKADKKAAKEEEKAAKEVTRAGVSQAFSSMFGEKY